MEIEFIMYAYGNVQTRTVNLHSFGARTSTQKYKCIQHTVLFTGNAGTN
jgi:hypothetical protein